MNDPIRYLTNQQIDKEKWDQCISRSINGRIYGYSFYLDLMANNWDAIVLDDYEAVMPLPWKKKIGIKYIYQPFLTAMGGVFGDFQSYTVKDFLDKIPPSFRFIDISLNVSNFYGNIGVDFTRRTNYILDLSKPYETICSSYNDNTRRNIKKSIECRLDKNFDVEKVVGLAVRQMRNQGQQEKDNIDRFRKLFQLLNSRGMATTYGIFAKNQLLASCVFFFSHNRYYYILVGNHPVSKKFGASHALIDGFIKDHAGQFMLLDFEGSDIESLAFFYSGFGAIAETYPALKINRLPFFLKWMKK